MRNPGVDTDVAAAADWGEVLAHRPVEGRQETVARLAASGITAAQVRAVLCDGGDELYAAARRGGERWAEPFGGPLAAALLAAEVSALAAHLTSRAAGVRSLAVDQLLDEVSAVTVAARLGVSRQKVYDVARGGLMARYVDRVPWRQP
jgi:hypothetical protein